MKRLLLLLLVLILIGGFAFARGRRGEAVDSIKVGMVTDVGGVHDNSFNQSAWEGLQRAQEEIGIDVSYLESAQETDYGPNMETMYDAGNSLIWGIGFLMGDATFEAATSNPDTNYAIIDFAWADTPDNLVGVVFKAQEPSFLVGYIAGKMTETNIVGFVGGIAGNIIDGFDYGYHAGVKYANPDVTILRQYADSFTDAALGIILATRSKPPSNAAFCAFPPSSSHARWRRPSSRGRPNARFSSPMKPPMSSRRWRPLRAWSAAHRWRC